MRTIVLIVALLLAVGEPLRAAAADCAAADALLEASYVAEAKDAYKELLGGDSPPDCAREGLRSARAREAAYVAERCSLGQLLLSEGQLAMAKAVFTALTNDESALTVECAHAGLADLTRREEELARSLVLEQASELGRLGLRAEAAEVLLNRLKSDDEARVPPDLDHLFGGSSQRWRAFRRGLEGWAVPVLEMAAAAVLVLLIVALIGRRTLKPALAIEEFKSEGLGQDQVHLGKDFAAIARSQLNRLSAGSASGRIHQVTGPIEGVKLPDEVEAVLPTSATSWLSPAGWAKAIPPLLNWLAPPRVITLRGQLHRAGARGVGASVQLAEGEKLLGSYSFWRSTFDDPAEPAGEGATDAYRHLAQFAAVWLMFELKEQLESGVELLGTANWRSYAFFQAGLVAEESDRETAARNLYVKALRLDPRLRGARVNLGELLIRAKEYEAGIEQLHRAKTDCIAADDGDRDPTLYSAMYNLAAVGYELARVEESVQEIDELLVRIDRALDAIDDGLPGYEDRALGRHLEAIRPVAEAMAHGLAAELGKPGARTAIEALALDVSSVYPRFHYNMACAYSSLAQFDPPDPEEAARQEKDLASSLAFLERCLRLFPGAAAQASVDPCFEWVKQAQPSEFDALIRKYTPRSTAPAAPPGSPLADVHLIGKQHAKSLAAEKIDTCDGLLLAAIDPAARSALAAKLNVTEQLLLRWAHAMDLLRVVGLEAAHLRLLWLAGIHRLTELAARTPTQLKALLDDLADAVDGATAPDLASVTAWVADAQTNTQPKVVI